LGEAVGPESFPSRARERPREPDTDNTGVGNGKVNRILFRFAEQSYLTGMRFNIFWVELSNHGTVDSE